MLDISRKTKTFRTAVAQATVTMKPETLGRIQRNDVPKGNPLEVARVAAIQAAKCAWQIIPFCHPLPVDFVGVEFELGEKEIVISATVKAIYKTGVEMEALTAASVAALTLYDMLKMLDGSLEIRAVKLIGKQGGKSDYREEFERPLRSAVLVMSDTIAAGKKDDLSGRLIEQRLKAEGFAVEDYRVIADDAAQIRDTLIRYADTMHLDLVVTTGGTGFGPRDTTPEAMMQVIEREIPGIPEALRSYGQERTPFAMLSRGKAGLRGRTVIINLPGSKRGAAESLDALFPGLRHAFAMLGGGGHPSAQEKRRR
jgi:molybdenum cofactor biosynthesis protein MoaC